MKTNKLVSTYLCSFRMDRFRKFSIDDDHCWGGGWGLGQILEMHIPDSSISKFEIARISTVHIVDYVMLHLTYRLSSPFTFHRSNENNSFTFVCLSIYARHRCALHFSVFLSQASRALELTFNTQQTTHCCLLPSLSYSLLCIRLVYTNPHA